MTYDDIKSVNTVGAHYIDGDDEEWVVGEGGADYPAANPPALTMCGNCPHDPDAHSPVNEELCSFRDCSCPGLLTVTIKDTADKEVDRLAAEYDAAAREETP